MPIELTPNLTQRLVVWTPRSCASTSISTLFFFFFFNEPAPPEFSSLPLPAALPLWALGGGGQPGGAGEEARPPPSPRPFRPFYYRFAGRRFFLAPPLR